MTCLDGGVLRFNRDIGVYKGFPYVDHASLQDHIVTTHKSILFKENLLSKLKSVMDIPKNQGFTMVKTVQKNMEGFTKQDIQGAYLAHKAQALLAHP